MRSAFALRIFSGKFILNFGVLKSLRTFQNPFFTGGAVKASGRCSGLALSGAYAPDPPFCRCATSSPGAGEVFPQRESPWHRGKVFGKAIKFAVSPEPLPLGEVDLRSKDGEGEDACQRTRPRTARRAVRGCCVMIYTVFTIRKVFPRWMQSSSRSYAAGTSPMTFTFSSAGKSARTSWISPE
mgnify:CR=1 FL=1